jgi:cytochrome c5
MAQQDTFTMNLKAVLIGLVILAVVVFVADRLMREGNEPGTRDPMKTQAIAERIQPVGQVSIATGATPTVLPPPPATPATMHASTEKARQVYTSACFVCHETGAADAPRRGDKAAWQPRLAQGMETLVSHVRNGFNAMPPRAGNPALSDVDIIAAVTYLVEQAH